MRKTTPYSIQLIVILLIGLLSSCVSENCAFDNPDQRGSTETTAVFIRLVGSEFATRSSSEHIPDGTFLEFNDGYLFLATELGTIRQRYRIIPTSGTVDVDVLNQTIYRGALNNGVTIPVVPGDVRRVIIVGNYGGTTMYTTGNVPAVRRRGLNINSQYNALHVNLLGEESLALRTTGILYYEHNNVSYRIWDTSEPVFLEPTVARFEINSIRGAGDIASFAIEGIFIDNFYRHARIDGTITNADGTTTNVSRTTGGQNRDAFTQAAYAAFDANFGLHTWYGGTRGGSNTTSLIVRPDDQRVNPDHPLVWSYQVFAQSHNHIRNVSHPNIVVRLSNIVLTDGTPINGDRFVTVGSFTHIDNNNAPLQHIRARHIYRLEMIEFDSRALSRYPNDNPINANVTISVDSWYRNVITPNNPLRQPQLQPMTLDFNADIPFLLGTAMGGTWNFTYRWYYAAYDPFDAAPPFGSSEWTPIGGNLQSLSAGTRSIGTENLWIRRVVYDNNETIYTAALMSVPAPTLDVDPPIWVFMGSGTQTFDVTTNYLSWDVTGEPSWATLTRTGDTFTLEIDHAYDGSSRTAVLTVTAGSATPQLITVTQIGDNASHLALPNAFVGAFWRNNQWGERLIRIEHSGDWTAIALDDWIMLDRSLNWTRPVAESAVNMTTDDHFHRLNPATARSAVRGTNNIYFRIGLTGANPNTELCPTTNRAMPRYGQVAIVHNNNQSVHIIWVRQGEAADYVMRVEDLMDNDAPRLPARRFSPFNLTAETLNMQAMTQEESADESNIGNRTRFVQYPSQGGAHFQWAHNGSWHNPAPPNTHIPRMAWATVGTATEVGWTIPIGDPGRTWGSATDNFAMRRENETCPPGYRRPHDGSITQNITGANMTIDWVRQSEMRQSLFLSPRTGEIDAFANSVYGFYADGFFDRRPMTNAAGNVVGRTTVAWNDPYRIAHRGRLFFNPTTSASLFFPAAGSRHQDAAGALEWVGNDGVYITATRIIASAAWSVRLGPGRVSMFNSVVYRGYSIRCIADD